MTQSIKERYALGVVLGAVARLLPFWPRDFSVDITEKPGGQMSINLKALTEMGAAILPLLNKSLSAELAVKNIGHEDDGQRNTDTTRSDTGADDDLDAQSNDGRSPGSNSGHTPGGNVQSVL